MDNYEKKYKEALERARSVFNEEAVPTPSAKGACKYIFPELAESEDEKIRKELIFYFQEEIHQCSIQEHADKMKEFIAWLKKQGEQKPYGQRKECKDCQMNYAGECKGSCQMKRDEQKPTDKVEPKFHEGDWLIYENGSIYYVNKVYEHTYELVIDNGDKPIIPHELIDKKARLWTIQDAKDGDVLACPNDAGDRDVVFIFKNLNSDEGWVFCFCASDANGCFCTNNDYVGNSNSTNISPATKEQRDLLFQKMKESGYEWDAEKKELRKIEQNLAWSEEDEKNLRVIVDYLIADNGLTLKHITWLKSLKDRFTWKPSEEQIEVLLSEVTAWTKGCPKQIVLESLYNDLKKLREE